MFKFRNYQKLGIRTGLNWVYDKSAKSGLLVGPAGSGKGDMICFMIKHVWENGGRVLFTVHREDLVRSPNSIYTRLTGRWGVPTNQVGFALSGERQVNRPIMLSVVNTAINRPLKGDPRSPSPFTALFVDEAHRFRPTMPKKPDGMFKKLRLEHPEATVVGFTATPQRGNRKELLGFEFDQCFQFATHRDLVNQGYLVPTQVIAPLTPDLSGVAVRGGEFVEKDLADKVFTDPVLEAIGDKIRETGWGRTGITYTINSIKQCEQMVDILRDRGFSVAGITSKTKKRNWKRPNTWSSHDRVGIQERLESGELDHLVNIQVMTEGISIDRTDFICNAYSTMLMAKHQQVNARGDRPLWNEDYTDWLKDDKGMYVKPSCLILDCGNNFERLGRIEDYLMRGVDIHTIPPKKPKGEIMMKKCPQCDPTTLHIPQIKTCPFCGFEFPFETTTKDLAGDVEWRQLAGGLESEVMQIARLKDKYIVMQLKGFRKPRPELIIPIMIYKKGMNDMGYAIWLANEAGYCKADPSDPDQYKKVVRHLERKTYPKYEGFIRSVLQKSIVI